MSEKKNTAKRRSALQIMGSLIELVKPLLHIMMAAIILGTLGYLCAIFLTILAGQVIVHGLLTGAAGMTVPVENMWLVFTPVKTIITVMIVIAVLRGILHYMEQYCNHSEILKRIGGRENNCAGIPQGIHHERGGCSI